VAIEKTMTDAKKLIHQIAPQGDMFRVLWIQYDIHNLRVFAKAIAGGLDFDGCAPFVTERGVYEPEYLYEMVETSDLDFLQPGWQQAFNEASRAAQAGRISEIDVIFDELYFKTSGLIAKKSHNAYIRSYVQTRTDLHNLKVRLRVLKNEGFEFTPTFIEGGTIMQDSLETVEDVYSAFARYGGEGFWREALDYYRSTGNTTSIDAKLVEYQLVAAKEASYDMFSSASLALYYLRCRQAAANVRTIVVGKNSGMKESAIRANLITAYVND
jgi:vacuolar-type H+-ATPase subunit C/Vma6